MFKAASADNKTTSPKYTLSEVERTNLLVMSEILKYKVENI
jgi:hypothetical protein